MFRAICVLLLSASLSLAAEEVKEQHEVSGAGAFPLSSTVTAQWLTGPMQGPRPQPLIMVYYRGRSGWHERKWEQSWSVDQSPAVARLVSEGLELSIEYGKGGVEVKVQDQLVDYKSANVFLVSPVADPTTKPSVTPLGFVMFTVPDGPNPASYTLKMNPTIEEKVMNE